MPTRGCRGSSARSVSLLRHLSYLQEAPFSIISSFLGGALCPSPLPPLLPWALFIGVDNSCVPSGDLDLERLTCCSANFVSYRRGRKKWSYPASTSTTLTVTFGSTSISLRPGSVCQIISQFWQPSGQGTRPGTPWSWSARYEVTWGCFLEKNRMQWRNPWTLRSVWQGRGLSRTSPFHFRAALDFFMIICIINGSEFFSAGRRGILLRSLFQHVYLIDLW